MTLIKRFLLALALPLFLASHSNAQVSTTSNLIQNDADRWTSGCYTLQSEGFWGGTSGGPCPGIWDNRTQYNGQHIIFSYGQQTLSQTHSLASALPNSGTGLQVNGYNWHWHVKNSNINDTQPGGYDTTAYVTVDLLNGSGSVLESDKYDYGYRLADWTKFSGTRTYTNPFSTTQADSIRLSVTGRDDQYWAGYYGPEFSHFTLSVNYSVDPCYDNPLYSSTCSGFAEALAKLTPDTLTEDTTGIPEITQYGNNNTSSIPTEENTVAATPTIDAGGIEVSTTGELIIPGDAPKETVEQKQVVEEKKEEKKVTVDYSLIAMVVRQATDLTNVMSVVNQSIMQSTESQVPASSSSGEEIAITTESATTTQESTVNNVVTSQDNNNQQTTVAVETKTTQQTAVQQTRAQPNEAASGGVSMNDFAKAPADFSAYQTQLADASFYAPKEIYKGQVNVDNRRAMRGLGSDRLHQEMVRQQYQ